MFTAALPQRPRPPAGRRAPLRSIAGEAPALPSKQALSQQSPVDPKSRIRQENIDMYTSPIKRHGSRRRPLSMVSDASVQSPPPPYGGGRTVDLSPDHKSAPMVIPPPPPEPLESGPSSVRTSLLDNDGPVEEDEDDDEPGNTLTLRGVQKLIRQHEFETMATELQGRLLHLTDSPNANSTTLPSLFDTEVIHSPQRAAPPSDESPARRRLRTVPSDPCLAFSRPRARVGSGNSSEIRELRLAAVRAEEDAALIAQLESALADARDSEEAQRKAAARLRRDLSRVKRELEHAEDVITDQQRTEKASSEVGRERVRAADRVAEWTRGTSSLSRARGSYGPPPDDDEGEPVGWGATSFPEFPREEDVLSEAGTEVATISPTRESREATPDEATAPPPTGSSPKDHSEAPTVIVPERVRPRPIITATTFATPPRDAVASNVTPQVTVDPPTSRPSSSQASHGPTGAKPVARILRSSGSASSLLRESMRVRSQSYVSNGERLSPVRTIGSSDSVGVARGHSPSASIASGFSQDSERSRIDSVRSIFSAVVGLHRSLGSELGSTFHPTPTKESEGYHSPQSGVSLAPFTPLATTRQRRAHSREPSSPTATFHFRGTLESPSRATAYDYEHPDAPRRMGPVAAEWSPQSWPTPTPPPRDVPIPPVPELYYPDEHQEHVLRTPVPVHASWPPMPGAGPGATPSPHATTALAPCADPWDEYSDRPTPSPRARNLRPLLLCTRPAMHMRTSSLALARDRAARGVGYTGLARESMPISERVPEPTPSNVAVAYAHRGGVHLVAPTRAPAELILPVTIPGRITHDLFCLVLVFIDYLEWFIILLYRFTIDIRAGPGGAEPALGFKRRQHPKRFYL